MKDELRIISGESVFDGGEALEKASRDTSIFEVRPKFVVNVGSASEVEKIVELVKGKNADGVSGKFSLTARAAGTDMTGGPLTDSILLSFTQNFNRILEIGNDFVICEPGVFFRDLEKELALKNLWYPPYPASKDLCAVGGIVNNNSGGEKTLRYGKTQDYVLGLEMVLADGKAHWFEKIGPRETKLKMGQKDFEGEIYRKLFELLKQKAGLLEKSRPTVSKNSSGFNVWQVLTEDGGMDLTKLFCGAQGTLGLMTKVKLKVLPKLKFDKLYVVYINNLNQLPEFTKEVLELSPTSLEITDDHTFKIYLRYAREMASVLGAGGILEFVRLFLPDALMILRGGIPKLVLLAEFEGNDEADGMQKIAEMEKIVRKLKMRGRFAKDGIDANKYWKLRRDTFKLLREKVKGVYPTPFVDDLEVHPNDLPDFWPKLVKLLDESGVIYTISGHLGDGNLHIIPLMNIKDPAQREKIWELTPKVYDLVLSYGGTITAEHNDGMIRGPFLEKAFGVELFELFKEIKKIFDNDNLFNPNKKTDASMDWSKSHMKVS